MRIGTKSYVSVFFIIVAAIVGFQNCGPGRGSASYSSTSPDPVEKISPKQVEQQTVASEKVAIAEVTDTKSEKIINEYGDHLIVTKAQLKVTEQLKGSYDSESPSLVVKGGTVDGITMSVSDQIHLNKGDKVVVFSRKNSFGREMPSRGKSSVLHIKDNMAGGMSLNEIRSHIRAGVQK